MNTGFKLVNAHNRKDEIIRVLEYFILHQRYLLEIGYYFDRNQLDYIFSQYCKEETWRVNMHTNHRHSVFSLEQNEEDILDEVMIGKSINSQYSVIHLTPSKQIEDQYSEEELLARGLPLLTWLNHIGEVYQTQFYIENTYHDIGFYEALFERINRYQLRNIHFCFDMGHAKVFSGNHFFEWNRFLQELQSYQFKIHFHLHMNHGFADEHLSFKEFDPATRDGFTCYKNYKDIIRDLIMNYPEERKIFEVDIKYAIQNIRLVDRLLEKPLVAI